MSNFKFLLSEPGFTSFADVAIAAEKILHIDPAACILKCRRTLAFEGRSNKSKLTIQQSLDKLETLKKSLMQEYFG